MLSHVSTTALSVNTRILHIIFFRPHLLPLRFSGKEASCSPGNTGLIPELGRFPGEGNGNPLQYSCLENPMDRGTWRATVLGVAKE